MRCVKYLHHHRVVELHHRVVELQPRGIVDVEIADQNPILRMLGSEPSGTTVWRVLWCVRTAPLYTDLYEQPGQGQRCLFSSSKTVSTAGRGFSSSSLLSSTSLSTSALAASSRATARAASIAVPNVPRLQYLLDLPCPVRDDNGVVKCGRSHGSRGRWYRKESEGPSQRSLYLLE